MSARQDSTAQYLELRGVAKSTLEIYERYARQFVEHYGCSADQLGREQVRNWLSWLSETKRLSPGAVNIAIVALRHLFVRQNRPEVMAVIRAIQRRPPSRHVLSASEVQRLLSAATNLKHRAMFSLLYGTGLRISELLALKTKDIDRERRFIRVRGPTTRVARIVPLSPQLLRMLREYLRSRRPDEQWLFPGRAPGSQMTREALSEAMRDCARRAGISKKVHPHLLRRAFAIHLLELGADRRWVQTLLGHEARSSTTRYTQLTDAWRAVAKARTAADGCVHVARGWAAVAHARE
jgi:integrase/recombinase XerD